MAVTEAFQHAQLLHRAGQLAQAAALYRDILRTSPTHIDTLCMLALLEYQGGRPGEALRLLDQALAVNPASLNAVCNRGSVLLAMKRYEEALASMDRALALRADLAEVHFNRGVILNELKRRPEALASYDRALALKPEYAEAWVNRGNVLDALAHPLDALASYERAAALRPDLAVAHFNLGNALRNAGRGEEALASYARALALKPEYVEAWNNRANVLRELNRPEEALPDYERALALKPDYVDAVLNRGIVLNALNRHEEALACFARVLALQPDHAEAHYCVSLHRLLAGDFERGWQEYEWRWRVHDAGTLARHAQPLWLGREDLSGKTILLPAEQGYGDTLQFCRYAALVAGRGARVILEVQPPLKSLLARLAGPAQVLAQGDTLPPFDFHCPLMSLPLAFHTTLETIPAAAPYLTADPVRADAWRARLGSAPALRVGLAWSGRPTHRNDTNRSIPLVELAPLLESGASFVSLQKELRACDQETLAAFPALRHYGDLLQDYADTAALIDCLDLVITVDTSVAHLAGALGKPVWILLPFDPDWRWLLGREDSPWYPTARLFRQARLRDWGSVILRVRDALRRQLHSQGK
jgi:tetratricopeptide (TPR) repeat protein